MEEKELTAKQERAILALLSAPTISAAAANVGIGETTLYLWLKEPSFAAAYRDARREAVQHALGRLQEASSEAAEVLKTVMNDPKTPANNKIAAASKILDMSVKGVELDDLAARIAALEAASTMGSSEEPQTIP
jgi:hypothetical protein